MTSKPANPSLPLNPDSLPIPQSEKDSSKAPSPPHSTPQASTPRSSSPVTMLGFLDLPNLPEPPSQASTAVSGNTNVGRSTVLPKLGLQETPVLIPQSTERYEELQAIGRGGAGDIVLVKDNDIDRMVAMKCVRTPKENPVRMLRFIEEIKTTGQLEHPNIVPIHDVGINSHGQYYYTMKFVDGETLESIIRQLKAGDKAYHERFNFERRTQIFVEILYAIHFAHQKGFIHRDLKPANIMVGNCGEVVVMDWGIAKQIKNAPPVDLDEFAKQEISIAESATSPGSDRYFVTEDGMIVGTPAYMSPEQIMGKNTELDERSDIYSLCVVFYEFLTLQHYLEKDRSTLQLLSQAIIEKNPVSAEHLEHPHQGRVPRELAFFLRQGLQKQPEHRFQSVREMLDILERTIEGRLCVHCPSTFLKRFAHDYGRYLDNHRYLGVAIASLFALFALFGLASFTKLLFFSGR